MEVVDWDSYFISLAYLVASRSKDRNTHIGSVVVGPNKEIRSTGYNSFSRGINDNLEERQEKPEKYFWFAHSEFNAVILASFIGVSLKDCTIYTNGIPCCNCAMAIINSGIREVVVDKEWNDNNYGRWLEESKRTCQMFEEAGVKLRFWEGSLIQIYKYRNGEVIK